ncbi:MAG: hypothetical protein K9W43_01840 [Candidatus Thorarchaeota archaeon]|nr:hypothetical protein [Candidatus Thorarchaeota archaeon]
MMKYITRVSIWFYSEGASPAKVIQKLLELGFTPVRGAYDFVYEHQQSDMTEKDLGGAIIEIANALHIALKGFKVWFNLDTHPSEDDPEYVPLEAIDAELEATRKEISELEREM